MMNSTGYVKSRYGSVFDAEQSKLFCFERNSVSVLRGWPILRAWKKTCVKHPNWIGFRPSLSTLEWELNLAGEKMESYRRAIEAGEQLLPLHFPSGEKTNPYVSAVSQWYFETTPPEIRELVKPFRHAKWPLLTFLAVGGSRAKELLRQNPAIAFLLAHNRVFHAPKVTQPLRAVRSWLKPEKKRKGLLTWLGFPATKSTIRVLTKMPCEDISVSSLLRVRSLLQNPEYAKLLRHQPVIDRALLAFFDSDLRKMLTPKLLGELRQELLANAPCSTWRKREQRIYLLTRDTVRMFRELRPDSPLPRVQNFSSLLKMHDALAEAVWQKRHENNVFSPPMPGNQNIVPVTDYAMLCEEGRLQHNCAASYAQAMLSGTSFLYRVLSPERSTLELVKRNRKWHLRQLLAACNRPVENETKSVVSQWLKENGITTKCNQLTYGGKK